MEQAINSALLLRLLNIQEFFTQQWLMVNPHDRQKISDLMNIKKHQLSLQELMSQEEDQDSGGNGSSGRGTIRGLRAKNDKTRSTFMKRR